MWPGGADLAGDLGFGPLPLPLGVEHDVRLRGQDFDRSVSRPLALRLRTIRRYSDCGRSAGTPDCGASVRAGLTTPPSNTSEGSASP